MLFSDNLSIDYIGQPLDPERPFSCVRCGRLYKWKSSLKSHIQNECGKDPQFKCPECPYCCKVRSNLLKHIRNSHGVGAIVSFNNSTVFEHLS